MSKKHNLHAAGAPHDENGGLHNQDGVGGDGRALCSCGWLSPSLSSGRQRKAAHKDHVRWVEAAAEAASTVVEDIDRHNAATEAPVAEAAEAAEDVEALDFPEYCRDVPWPSSVGRIFWRPMARVGAGILATAYDLGHYSNESADTLRLFGPLADKDAIDDLATRLPALFVSANRALRAWRRSSNTYRSIDIYSSAGRKAGWTAEQAFLREWFRAVAGFTSEGTLPEGYEAGLAYASSLEELV